MSSPACICSGCAGAAGEPAARSNASGSRHRFIANVSAFVAPTRADLNQTCLDRRVAVQPGQSRCVDKGAILSSWALSGSIPARRSGRSVVGFSVAPKLPPCLCKELAREDVEMAKTKRASKRKRAKVTLPAWGAAGMSLAMAGGASAAVAPTANTPAQGTTPVPIFTLSEEEISDVSLATFYVFDQETLGAQSLGTQLARACGGGGGRCGGGGGRCGGAGRCAGGGGAGRCAAGRCAAGRCAAGRCGAGCGAGRCAGGCRCGCGVGVGVVACGGCSCSCCLSWGACDVSC
jgi:hypothetical protein